MLKINEALGLCELHVTPITKVNNLCIHNDLVEPLSELQACAKAAGFDLAIASGFRSFERQQFIWNQKALGRRPVLSAHEEPLDIALLSEAELISVILQWSALPGASRHHWGCDIDIFDNGALNGQALQLTTKEVTTVFAPFYEWLAYFLEGQKDFFRPFDGTGNIAGEPWHLSFAPVARQYQALMSESTLRDFYSDHNQCGDLALRESILDNISFIYQHYIEAYFI